MKVTGVDDDLTSAALPRQVLDGFERLSMTNRLEQLTARLLGGITSEYEVDEGVADELLVVVARRQTAHQDVALGMELSCELRDGERRRSHGGASAGLSRRRSTGHRPSLASTS